MPETLPQLEPSPAAADRGTDPLRVILRMAGISAARQTGWIRVTGEDRVRWLNGMVSNSVQHLEPGTGCYTFLLNAQGRIQGDAYVFAERDQILLRTDSAQVLPLMTHLDRFVIMDDVELADISPEWEGLLLAGPEAEAKLQEAGLVLPKATPGLARTELAAGEVITVRVHGPVVPRLEIWAEAQTLREVGDALRMLGVEPVEESTLEQLRVLEGTPRYGIDIKDRDLPQETGQQQALHFAKGCYLGQEIVERIRSRGSVHRHFSGFLLEGTSPEAGATLHLGDKLVGELTSFARITLPSELNGELLLAMGYLRQDRADLKSGLTYHGGTANIVELPYAPAQLYASKILKEG